MTLTRPLTFSILCALSGMACDQGETPIGGFDDAGCTPSDDGADDDGTGVVSGPLAVDCSFFYQDVQTSTRFTADGSLGGGPPVDVQISDTVVATGILSDTEIEGRSFSIRVLTGQDELLSSTLYQMDPQRHPANEFWGDHGFTGLNYVRDPSNGETLQFACFASKPEDPIHEWED